MTTGNELTKEQWLEIRKQEGLKIDPETAEVTYWHALTVDPYGILDSVPDEYWQVGREYFARSPDSAIWVHFSDLPMDTFTRLWTKVRGRQFSQARLAEVQPSRPPRLPT